MLGLHGSARHLSRWKWMLAVAALLLLVRAATVAAYRDTYYYYGMIAHQFALADGAYRGHGFAYDPVLSGSAMTTANRERRYVPLEEWERLPASGRYVTFPAVDLPGMGFLIAHTSRWLGRLTAWPALAAQVAVETASVLLFAWCVAATFGDRVALFTALTYALAYPFIWPLASLPMRDVFVLGFYASLLAAVVACVRRVRGHSALALLLLGAGSALLWVRPHGYYFNLFVLPLVAIAPLRIRARLALGAALALVPWLVFGSPLRAFNSRHYGVADTGALARSLWQQMGVVKGNRHGFALDDTAMQPWIKLKYGRDVEYMSPEMNRILGDYALQVIRDEPFLYLESVVLTCLEMAKTPLDFVPPFPLVEYSSSGLDLREFAHAHPGSFAFKLFNRALVAAFFYGALLLALRMALRERARRFELALLLSPLAFTLVVQALLHAEARYMTVGAWVLALPIGHALAGFRQPPEWRA